MALTWHHVRLLGLHALNFARKRIWLRILTITTLVIIFLGIVSPLAVPLTLRWILTGRVAASIHRRISVGKIRFNLYTLRLDVDRLHIDRGAGSPLFVDLEHFRVRVSWSSAYKFAPVIAELTLRRPTIRIVRNKDGSFNFSDLLAQPSTPPPTPPPEQGSSFKFAVSNIRIIDGDVGFDDRMFGVRHSIKKIQIGVPFVANLPAALDVVVQPKLEMRIDGRPVTAYAVTKPFSAGKESAVRLRIHRLDIPGYVAFMPNAPVKIPSGTLSMSVIVHFIEKSDEPTITLTGAVALDEVDVRDRANGPVLSLEHAVVKMTDVEPLGRVAHLGGIFVNTLKANVIVNQDGTMNLAMPAEGSHAPSAPAAAPTAAAATPNTLAQPAAPSPPFDATVDSIRVISSSAKYTNLSGANPISVALDGIGIKGKGLGTITQTPGALATVQSVRLSSNSASYTDLKSATPLSVALDGIEITGADFGGQTPGSVGIAAKLRSGGDLRVKGSVDLPKSDVAANVSVEQVDLPALQAFAQDLLAGKLNSGKFTAHVTVSSHFRDQFNLRAEKSDVSLDNLELASPTGKEKPVSWDHFGVTLDQFDLAQRQAVVKEVRLDGLHVSGAREANGNISLMSLIKKSEPPAHPVTARRVRSRERKKPTAVAGDSGQPPAAEAPSGPPWQYRIETVALEKIDAKVEDRGASPAVRAQVAPLNIHLKDVSSDFAKPIAVQIDGAVNQKSTIKIDGSAAIAPMKANLNVDIESLDLSPADAYLRKQLNTRIKTAALTVNGAIALATVRKEMQVKYRGDVTLGKFNVLDRVTGDEFAKWEALSLNKIDAEIGGAPPKVHIGEVALSDFYARVILNRDGKLNLNDVVAQQAPTSVTRAKTTTAAPPPPPEPETKPPAEVVPTPHPIDADIALGEIRLHKGKIYYTDNFIKPNYSANLTDMDGKIGAFGTQTTTPADIALEGLVNGNSPINISGSMNPLAPMASLDIKAKAEDIELTQLSTYSTKYTGYPITRGTLSLDIHYMLSEQKLTAENHIFLDQLTFGDRVANSNAANLPIRLAVSLLKDSKGEINLDIPVSGSLSDPQFSIGSVLWTAFKNLILKAVTSPFSLLAAGVSGLTGGSAQDLSYIEFEPGRSALSSDSRKRLNAIAIALQDRPSVKVEIIGRADPEFDRQGLREATVADQVRQEKVKDTGKEQGTVEVSSAENEKYLKKAYSNAKFYKPRNAIGIAKSLPPEEMKKLMVTNIDVTQDDLRKLAEARANAVRSYLAEKVDPGRISVGQPKMTAEGIKEGKTTRVDFVLE